MNKFIFLIFLSLLTSSYAQAFCFSGVDELETISKLNDDVGSVLTASSPLERNSYITPNEYRLFSSREIATKIVNKINLACDEKRGDKEGPTIGDKSDIMMYVPSGVIDSISKFGFQNQHVTRTTNGCNCREQRYNQEIKLSGTIHGYGSKAKDVLPKYSALNEK